MFLVNMLDAESMLESLEDITAAEFAPSPMKHTAVGVRYWSTIGSIIEASPRVYGSGSP